MTTLMLILIYIWLKLSTVIAFFSIGVGICGGICLVLALTSNTCDDWWKHARKFLIAGIALLIVAGMLPTKKDVVILLASYAVLEVVQSDTVKKIASNSVTIIEKALKEYAEELPDLAKTQANQAVKEAKEQLKEAKEKVKNARKEASK